MCVYDQRVRRRDSNYLFIPPSEYSPPQDEGSVEHNALFEYPIHRAPTAAGIAFGTSLFSVAKAMQIIRINTVLFHWLSIPARRPGVANTHPKLAVGSRWAAAALQELKSTLAPMLASMLGPRMATAARIIEQHGYLSQKVKSGNRGIGRRLAVQFAGPTSRRA